MARGRDYRLALGGAKIALRLVRRANRGGHAMRSFEIPACDASMLAERTDEHLELFREGEDAMFFESPHEPVEKIRYYPTREDKRARIARGGLRRVTRGRHTYQRRFQDIVRCATSLSRSEAVR